MESIATSFTHFLGQDNEQLFSEIEVNSGRIRSMGRVFYKPLFTDIEEKIFISIYKLGDKITHSRKVCIRKTSSKREFTPAIVAETIHLPGGAQRPLARASKPIRLLEIPTSPVCVC